MPFGAGGGVTLAATTLPATLGSTLGSNVASGELVSFDVRFSLVEGTSYATACTLQLPAGLVHINSTRLTQVAGAGTQVVDGALVSASFSSNLLTLTLGNLVDRADTLYRTQLSDDGVWLRVVARVLNSATTSNMATATTATLQLGSTAPVWLRPVVWTTATMSPV